MPVYSSKILPLSGSTITGPILTRNQLYSTITSGQTIRFTNAGATGRFGPTYANCISSYTAQPGFATWGSDKKLFDVSAGVQFWTVFKTGSYTITAAGAAGGISASGRGAIVTSAFTLNAGEILRIVVGQRGSGSGNYSGGGGGTAVSVYRLGSDTLLISAGGGQGTSNNVTNTQGNGDGRTTNIGVPAEGFGSYYDHNYGSDIANYWHGGGGGGWSKDGSWGGIGVWGMNHFVEGAALASGSPIGGRDEQGIVGGFGGGSASGRDGGTGGGGGGFDGGDCSYVSSAGAFSSPYRHGGGGSYSLNGAFSSTSSGASGNTGQGYIDVTCP